LAVVLALTSLACQQPAERPAYTELDCSQSDCFPSSRGAIRGGQANTGDSVDSDSAASRPDAGSVNGLLEVQLREAVDLQSTGTVEVSVPLAAFELGQEAEEPAAEADLGEPLLIPATHEGGWWLIQPSGEQAVEYFSSLVWLHSGSGLVEQPLFPRRVLDDLGSALAFNPTLADATAAHAVLRVEDSQGRGMAGVVAQAATGIVAYGAGGTASDALEASTETGLILWLNVPPGVGMQPLLLSDEQGEWAAPIPVRASAVTVATLVSP